MTRQTTLLTLSATVLLLLGCSGGDGPTGLERIDLAGSYEATTFTVTEDGSTTDVLAEGGSLHITLAEDGTASGTLLIPASLSETGEEGQASMSGTYTVAGNTVTFDQAADTFVRDMAFTFGSGRLEGEDTFGDTTVRVVLTRS